MMRRVLLPFVSAVLLATPALAQVPMVGEFVAEATCAATPSIREPERNPGDIATQAGQTYELIGRNAVPGSHYLIVVPGAEPERRWVAYGCGRVEDTGSQVGGREAETPWIVSAPFEPAVEDEYVLAVSWHPAFCETRRRLAECREGGRDDAGFSLHGLWPQPRGREYCDVPPRIVATDEAGDWTDLPRPALSGETRARLAKAMPGVVAGLDRHQWWKHGTCFSGDAETYFQVSLRWLDELNESGVSDLFEAAIGSELSANDIRGAFDEAFGRGAGDRVTVECEEANGRRLVRELRVALAGTVGDELAELIGAAPERPRGCPFGEVEAAGF